MKKMLLLAVFLLSGTAAFPQMDEMFYHPDKEWLGLEGKYEEIIFTMGADTVHSVLFKPADKPKATVIYFHGNGGNISKWAPHARAFTDAGFQVCMLDYRGYGLSTGTPTHLNIADDARELFSILIERKDVRRKPIILWGASIGSQAASLIALENSDKIVALVLDGAMTSFTDIAVATSPPEHAAMIRQYVPSPYSAREAVPQLNDIKLLFIHSEEDFIPIAGAREMYESVTAEKDFWLYEGPHVMAPVLYPEELAERLSALTD